MDDPEACEKASAELSKCFGASVYTHSETPPVWDTKQRETRSACWVRPSTTADVVEIMQVLVKHWCKFAVKGGGHSANPDDSVSAGGVTIDLGRMKSTTIMPGGKSVKLGGGHTLQTIYEALEPYNLSITGGNAAGVGLGGYALGGGISHFSPKYGLAVDNILEYEVVLPDATTCLVNEHSHPELYFALRGGGSNFGIVTSFTMRTFPQGPVRGEFRHYSPENRGPLAQATHRLTTTLENDTNLVFASGYSYNQQTNAFALVLSCFYALADSEPPMIETVKHIPYISRSVEVEWMSQWSVKEAAMVPPGRRNQYATITYHPSADIDLKLQQIMEEELRSPSLRSVPGLTSTVIFQPLPKSTIQLGKVRGGNALGIDVDGQLTIALLHTAWDEGQNDQMIDAYTARWIDQASQITMDAGKAHRFLYLNYASCHQDPFAGYGDENRERLIRIQKAVDPNGVFTSTGLCRGHFKLR